MKPKAVTDLADRLFDAGVRWAFGVTGSGPSLVLIEQLDRRGARYLPSAHEASAALIAGAIATHGSERAVSISIKGPGLANMIPGIVSNGFEGNPSLSISETYGSDVPAHRKHKRMDHLSLLSPIVKRVGWVDEDPSELFVTADDEIPGPIHLELAPAADPEPRVPSSQPPSGDLGEIQRFLGRSERPVVVVGSLALRRTWVHLLADLQVPILTTVAAKGALDESLSYSAGVYTGAGGPLAPEVDLINEGDLVLGLGLRNTEVLRAARFGRPLVTLDELEGDLTTGFDPDASTVVGEHEFRGLLEQLSRHSWGEELVASTRQRLRRQMLSSSWSPARCFEVLDDADEDHALVLDTGSFCTIGEHMWMSTPRRPFAGSSVGRYMGVGLPTAIGLSLAKPGLPVYCAVGDGGMHVYPAEIKTAVEQSLPLCVVLMTDGGYGSIAVAAAATAPRSAFTIARPSWWRVVEAMGCEAHPVSSATEFAQAVADWGKSAPLFLEAAFAPESYAEMTAGVR